MMQGQGDFLCRMGDLTDGEARLIAADSARSSPGLILLRTGDNVHAFENRCPHFGVPLAVRQEHLIFKAHASISCNNHYARFRWSDGYCEMGDCLGESLRPVALEISGDEVRTVAATDNTST